MDELIQIIQHRRQELVTEARERATRKLDHLSGQEEGLSTACATMQSVIEYTERCVEHSADDEIMCMHTELQSRIDSEIEQSKKEKNLEPVEEVDMGVEVWCVQDLKRLCRNKAKLTQFLIQPPKLTGEGIKLAKVNQASEIQLETKLSNGTPTKQSCIIECSLKSLLINGSTIKCNVSRVQTKAYKICYTPTVQGRHELTVTVNGRKVAGSPFPVHVSIHPTQLGKPVRVIAKGYKPKDVAINSAGEVVVVTSYNITLYDRSGRRLRSSKAADYNMSLLNGVTVDSSNDRIFVTGNLIIGSSHKIFCLSPDLKLYSEVNIDGRIEYWTGLTVVGKEVVLPDSKRSSVMVYTTELKYVRQIGSPGSGPGQFSNICDVSSDENGNLYISDVGKHCIHVFSKGGEFLRSFGSKGTDENKLKRPLGMCVSGQHVYVVDYDAHNICVFTTEGKYVTSFGQRGAKEGDLNSPSGVCVDKDGFVYVCDHGNNRLQIF